MTLTEITTKLEAISLNPCACNVCKHAAKLAREALMEVSPLGEQLLKAENHDSDEFRDLENTFREAELLRMLNALAYIARGRCMMRTPEKVEHTVSQIPSPDLPTLPYEEGLTVNAREGLERYRKYTMQRKPRIEMKRNPRIPGTYVIK